eukprot:15439045-Alexandrium_andersonii.AAC.1
MATEDMYEAIGGMTGVGAAYSVQSPCEQVISRNDLRTTQLSMRDSWENAHEFRMMIPPVVERVEEDIRE